MKRRTWLSLSLLPFALASCELLLGIDPDVNVIDDAATPDGETSRDAGADALADAGRDVSSQDPCPAEAGGPQVEIPDSGYCIDRTEVTKGAYYKFLAARGGDTSGQAPECAFNTTFVPEFNSQGAAADNLPIYYVTYCDAVAFCAWAGKRLCGAIDGGAVDPDSGRDPNVSAWHRACTHDQDGLHSFPYGNAFDASACNSYLEPSDAGTKRAVSPVGSYPGCVGGYDGIFDMAGNLSEIEDSCSVVDGGLVCAVRGGSFNSGFEASGTCSSIVSIAIDATSAVTGFRCCSK